MITLDQAAALLPQPTDHNQESWELKFLFQHKTDAIPQDILFAEVGMDTLRFTFPAISRLGRARIWLKRTIAPLTATDVSNYFLMINEVAKMAKLKIVLSESTEALLKRFGGDLENYSLPPARKVRGPR